MPTAAGNHHLCGPDLWQPSSLQCQLRSSSTESEPVNIRIVRAISGKTSLSTVTCLVAYCGPTSLLAAHNILQDYWTEIVAASVRAAVLHHATLRRRARKRLVSSNYFHAKWNCSCMKLTDMKMAKCEHCFRHETALTILDTNRKPT